MIDLFIELVSHKVNHLAQKVNIKMLGFAFQFEF